MSPQARYEAGVQRQVAILESSILLSGAQRAAQSGPLKAAADLIRKNFLPLAQAGVTPYLGNDAGADSTANLPDDLALKFPPQLVFFLPEEQRCRIVTKCLRTS